MGVIDERILTINERIAWAEGRIAECGARSEGQVIGWKRGIAVLKAEREAIAYGTDDEARRAQIEEEVRLHILDKRLKEKITRAWETKLEGKALDEQIRTLRAGRRNGFFKRIFGRN